MELPTVRFLDENCSVKFTKYANSKRIAIKLYCEDGSPMATATINIPEQPLEEDEVIIKTYSENNGVLEALKDAGYIKEVVNQIPCGHSYGVIVKLNPEYIQ